ncbi:MAG TPA: helix-turn-helix domain-containing protein [Flavisolibacter sp.]|nr:helix-turn-helix domain-containing protein [Flavisolibacter sp.]
MVSNPTQNITSEKQYNEVMERINQLMRIEESKLKDDQAEEIRVLSLAVEAYEKSIYTIPTPKTLAGILELKMYERKLKQKEMAKMLGVNESKLSRILHGAQPDVSFLKAAHQQLGIDGNILLEAI